MKKYWLTLYPDTFLWVRQNEGCIYNAVNFSKIRFENMGELAELSKELLNIDSLYRIELSEKSLQNPSVKEWINQIVGSASGKLVEDDGLNKRPVSLKPELKLQDGVEYYKWEHKQGIDGNIIHNLHKLVFQINGSSYGSNDYARQTIFPVKSTEVLDGKRILSFINNARCSTYLSEIILIGDISSYPDFNGLQSAILDKGLKRISVYCLANDFLSYIEGVSDWENDKILYTVLLSDYSVLDKIMEVSYASSVSFVFMVRSVEEYERAMLCIEKNKLTRVEIVPLYTGSNLSFFEGNLYMDAEGISEIELSKRDVFIRETINIFSFGNLTVLPNGEVYANLNDPSIGNIDETPFSIVYREMTEGKSWFRTRRQEPCCNCVYQWLCPSPSNYELIIGKSNLCFIK